MKALLVVPKSVAEATLVVSLMNKMKIPTKAFSLEHFEDVGLSLMMNNVNRKKKVTRESVMKKLRLMR